MTMSRLADAERLLALLLLASEGGLSRIDEYLNEYITLRETLMGDPASMFLPNYVKSESDLVKVRAFIRKIDTSPERRCAFINKSMRNLLARLKGDPQKGRDAVREYQQFLMEYATSKESLSEKLSEFRTFIRKQSALTKNKAIWKALPKFAKSSDFSEICTFLDMISEDPEERCEFILEEFSDARDISEIEKKKHRGRADDRIVQPPQLSPSNALQSGLHVHASGWTGIRSSTDQARYVLSLAPAALQAAHQLIEQHEVRLHNGPPGSVDSDEVLESLRELHRELGTLIELAEAGSLIETQVCNLRKLWHGVFNWSRETGELCVAGAKPLIASVPLTWGVWALLGAICEPAIFAAWGPPLAATVPAGYFGLSAIRAKARST